MSGKSNNSSIIRNNFHCKSISQAKKVAGRKSRTRWSQREKRLLLSVLKNVGHSDVNELMKALPLKNRYQISKYLNKAKQKASTELKKKYSRGQHTLQRIHQWISLLNLNEADSILHNNLSAFILPIVMKPGIFPSKSQADFELVNFKLAYRFIFESLQNSTLNQTEINDEIKALLFSGFNQITYEIKGEKSEGNEIFNSSVVKFMNQVYKSRLASSVERQKITHGQDIFSLFEINPFLWTNEEIRILCL
ncbi:uncharacterized protein LOC135832152 [Planococcus citri]|uniref:uncharacterized protein LOC135832152 n=1 Tax=Planococcus citri TaxID=170843 RepID=UPI0031F9C773